MKIMIRANRCFHFHRKIIVSKKISAYAKTKHIYLFRRLCILKYNAKVRDMEVPGLKICGWGGVGGAQTEFAIPMKSLKLFMSTCK